MPLVSVRASQVQIGDVIQGPDGYSTVIKTEENNSLIMLDFAEGRGNRCWSALLPEEPITRLKKSSDSSLQGFVVDRLGRVIQAGVVEVRFLDDTKLKIVSCDADGYSRERIMSKSEIQHITGYFRIYF